jgi:hypothetical protein
MDNLTPGEERALMAGFSPWNSFNPSQQVSALLFCEKWGLKPNTYTPSEYWWKRTGDKWLMFNTAPALKDPND